MQANKLFQKQYTKACENRKELYYCVLLDETKTERNYIDQNHLNRSYDAKVMTKTSWMAIL